MHRERWIRQWHSKILTIATLTCIIAFLYSTYHLYQSLPRQEAVAFAIPQRETGPKAQRIIEADIFTENELPIITGNPGSLELRGIFAGSAHSPSYAIIAETGQPEKSYQVGDRLQGGMELIAIHSDRIVVRQGKTQHIVYLRSEH